MTITFRNIVLIGSIVNLALALIGQNWQAVGLSVGLGFVSREL